ncbi:MAG: bifunctional diaminohydroxyphosphoribosylaminopyrimidine deaminase/5-amino-6-(5-phosphoribosylamino)uracil reductase RibD [Opitutaceae bacterium]
MSPPDPVHEGLMRRALALARGVWGETQPNPMVGAVLVEDGVIVAEGATAPDGGPHAERRALEALGRPPRPGATLYVTLEPCCTEGRTGACTARILAAGIRRVVVGAVDPNPAHAGRGLEVLRAAGVEVVSGVLAAECADLNLIFNHWITHGTPLLAAKVASTLDGKLACRTGDSQWITGEAARADVHRWRRLFPGIGVGAMTVLHDNPRLTVRPPGGGESCPVRFVFDGLLRTVVEKNLPRVFSDEFRGRTIVVTTPHGGLGYVRKLRDLGVQVWVIESSSQRVPFAAFRRRCAEERISGVLIEGGAHLISELLRARELDYLFAYHAPLLFADDKARASFSGLRPERVAQGVRLDEVRHESFGGDVLMRGRVVYPEKMLVDEAVFRLR